jgi:site-specific recombinase XerD
MAKFMAASKVSFMPGLPIRPEVSDARRGPLGPHLRGFANLLGDCGYSKQAIGKKVRLVCDLSRWMDRKHLKVEQLEERRVASFLEARWRRGPRRSGDQCTPALLLRHLRQAGLIPAPAAPAPSPADVIQRDYRRFLLQQRGLAPASARQYLAVARRFLGYRSQGARFRPQKLRTKDVTDFVLHDTSTRGRRSAQLMTVALRSFLSFLLQEGRVSANLAKVVPTVAGWRLSELPRYLEAEQVKRLLRSCERRTKVGKRDYAILLLLARLGLRAGEVTGLNLEDIDWHAGQLLIRGKGARVDRLPLVQEVGEAVADYLQKGRPRCSCRRVFVQSKAPYEGFAGSASISSMVGRVLARARIDPPNHGAHLFRHSLATGMLRNGASLAQISQVLRHQQAQTTEIYAKVDLKSLRGLAQPWPGEAR